MAVEKGAMEIGLSAQNKMSSEPGFEENAGCLSRFTFSWYTQQLQLGIKKTLNQTDLGRPHPSDDGRTNYLRMQKLWHEEVQRKGLKEASVGRVLTRFIGSGRISFLAFCAITTAVCGTVQPVLNKRLLEWLEGATELGEAQKWLLVLAIFLNPMIVAIVRAHEQFCASRTGVHLYSAMTQMLYHKSLRLSSHARNSASTGRLVNLMSSDAGTTMESCMKVLAPALTALPQLVVVMVLLFVEMELSFLAGIGFAFFSVPFAGFVFVKIATLYGMAMHEADQRLKFTNDLLCGIRVVKSYAWEKAFVDMIGHVRAKELSYIRRHAYWTMMGMMCIYMQLPALMQFVVYMTFVFMGGEFSAARIFTAIQLFSLLQQPLQQLPQAVNQLAQLKTAVHRLGAFLRLHELDDYENDIRIASVPSADEAVVEVSDDAVFTWEPQNVEEWRLLLPQNKAERKQEALKKKSEGEGAKELDAQQGDQARSEVSKPIGFELKKIGMYIRRGELVALVGPVGSGKSSLLSAVLNEMSRSSGTVKLRGSVAYAAQIPWIQNASLRDNILFGLPYKEMLYNQVLTVCALHEDVRMLEAGDMTEIGERGINLSGGQKARVSLARAAYCQADVVLLDDPLAAVDAHVGDTLFDECVRGMLVGKTVLLVTNQLHRLQHVDRVLVLKDGTIAEAGTFSDLTTRGGGLLASFLLRQGITNTKDMIESDETEEVAGEEAKQAKSPANVSKVPVDNAPKKAKILTEAEDRRVGFVNWNVYMWFLRKCGFCIIHCFVLSTTFQCYLPVAGSFVLAVWTEEVRMHGSTKDRNFQWLAIYGILVAGSFASSLVSAVFSAEGRVRGARRIHDELLRRISRASISFFDTTPIGRILNRFAKDLSMIDHQVLIMLSWLVILFHFLMSAVVAIVLSTKGWLIFLVVPILICYIQMFRFVRQSAIEIQRLESISRSPLASTFQEILIGLSTVRAYSQQNRFQETNTVMMNQNIVPSILAKSAQPAWLTLRLNGFGALLAGGCGFYAVVVEKFGGEQTAGSAGIGLTYGTMTAQIMTFAIFIMVFVETLMTSVERVKEYMSLQPEASEHIPGQLPRDDEWPKAGQIGVHKLVIGYRDGPDVLNAISFNVTPSEKIGVVGRTGSGKSTIILSMFRILEPRSGSIMIDGVDIARLGLYELRSKIGLIPQDPVLFVGTLRYNIDPFGKYSEDEIMRALHEVRMKDLVERLPKQLDQDVQEGGDNFSVGERQLFCIARALLRNPRVLFIDEATASVDSDTDAMLQNMIRTQFQDKTVMTIAHRLDTIMDSDRILVLDKGNIAAFDAPLKLLEVEDGIFTGLVNAGNTKHLRKIAVHGYLSANSGGCSGDQQDFTV